MDTMGMSIDIRTAPAVEADSLARFVALRRDLFAAIKVSLDEDGHCKSYEGALSIAWHLPHYFAAAEGASPWWRIHLDCYTVGPNRHYDWDGATFIEALNKCEHDVRRWIRQASTGDYDEDRS